MTNSTKIIAGLNDQLRRNLPTPGKLGRLLITESVSVMAVENQLELIGLVNSFDNFTEDNDPHQEHDFGKVEYQGADYFWKIDYYDKAAKYGSENPADPDQTTRIITIMGASEY